MSQSTDAPGRQYCNFYNDYFQRGLGPVGSVWWAEIFLKLAALVIRRMIGPAAVTLFRAEVRTGKNVTHTLLLDISIPCHPV